MEELNKKVYADPELMKLIRGVVNKREKLNLQEYLKRGVRHVGDIPKYVVNVTLSKLTGADASVFEKLTAVQNTALLAWALRAKLDHRLPNLGMPLVDYFAWTEERCHECGAGNGYN